MKKKILIGMALLLVVPLLVSCGVPQEDLDAAQAEAAAAKAQVASLQSELDAANSAKASAESDLATVQADLEATESELATAKSNLSAANSAKASLQSELDAALATIAELEAPAEEEEVVEEVAFPAISFTAATYTNADYGFSIQYPDGWAEGTWDTDAGELYRIGSGAYFLPGLKIYTLDEASGATLEEAFAAELGDEGEIISFEASAVTIGGTDFSYGVVSWATSYAYDGEILGVIKDGKWIVFRVYTIMAYWVFDPETLPSEVLGTVTFE